MDRDEPALEHKIEQLTRAIDSRDVIGQAKGLLMERASITSEEAFALLVAQSQQLNVKLRDVAAALVDAHNQRVEHDRSAPDPDATE